MKAIIYYITIPFIYLISLLPFPVLYLLSDIVFVLLFHVFGYRKKVVISNLEKSFPEKTPHEIETICKAFYKHLCDLILETLKTLTISQKNMLQHCYFTSNAQKMIDDYAAANKNIILVLGHYGNWEWGGNTFSLNCKQRLYVIYHPLENKYFDGLMIHMRTRFGTGLIAMKNTFREMLTNKDTVNATAFIADQTPSAPQNAYWTNFLNQETPVFKGTEVIAKKLNYPIVYIHLNKKKRGVYEMDATLLTDEPGKTADGAISEMHTKMLEADIKNHPEFWLWSHRRWKHKKVVV